MSQINRSVLLNASSSTDVRYSGGRVLIAGLMDTVKQHNIIDVSQINYRPEVQQVVTIGGVLYTPTGSTKYTVLIGDVNRRNEGQTEQLKPYSYVTPTDITTLGATAALQREAIHAQLVTKINLLSSNYVLAASLGGGNGFTITDDPGYYPYNRQGMTNREGASTVKLVTNSDGTGFASTNIVTTTAAVTAVGVGQDLLNAAPVMDFATGNLIGGVIGAPQVYPNGAFAIAGQKYNMFNICYLSEVELPTIGQRKALALKTFSVFVDNGTGTSTANAAGYLAFERVMHKIMLIRYNNDPTVSYQFFDQSFVIQGPLGAVPVATAGISNTYLSPYGSLKHVNIGAQTIVAPSQGANGLLIEQDLTATKGAAYTPDLSTANSQQFVVGKQVATVSAKASFTTPANIVFMVGFRSKEAHQAAFGSYQNLATVGTGPAGTALYTYGTLAAAANVATNSSTNAVTGVAVDFRVQLNIDGSVFAYINNVKYPIYSVGTTPLVFAAGTVLVPFLQYTNLNSAAAVPNVSEFFSVPTTLLLQ